MSQLIACKTRDAIVLAADSKAVDVDDYGNLIELHTDRLHQLSEFSAILTGGAVAGEAVCHSLKHFVSQENLTYIDEVYRAGLPLLASALPSACRAALKSSTDCINSCRGTPGLTAL